MSDEIVSALVVIAFVIGLVADQVIDEVLTGKKIRFSWPHYDETDE